MRENEETRTLEEHELYNWDWAWLEVLNVRGIDIGERSLRTFLNKVASGTGKRGSTEEGSEPF